MLKRTALALIRFYQRTVSPYTPSCCKYVPTCSEYALQAIEVYGLWKGGRLAVWRILRCNPFSKGGFDPVPEQKLKSAKMSQTGQNRR